MNKEELIEKLKDLDYEWSDTEAVHYDADILLIDYINDEEVEKAYNRIPKRYA